MAWARVDERRDGAYDLRAEAPGVSITKAIVFYDRHAALSMAEKIVGYDTEFELVAGAYGRQAWFGEVAA